MTEQGWEKTMLTRGDIRETALKKGLIGLAQKQAEISYKEGVSIAYNAGKVDGQSTNHQKHKREYQQAKLEGMKEVVEWIEEETTDIHSNGVMLTFYTKEWQQFLKEKGLC